MKFFFSYLFIHVSFLGFSQSIIFQKYYAGGDEGKFVQQTSDGGYIVVGHTIVTGSEDIYLIKTDSGGDTIWTKILASPVVDEWAYSVQQTIDGGYILAGSYLNGGFTDVYLLKTYSNGNIQWTKIYINLNNNEGGASVKQTADSGYIILGSKDSNGGDFYLIKTNSDGDTTWTKTYGGTSNDGGSQVQQTADGGYIMAGYSASFGAGGADVHLIKSDSNGNVAWTKTYGGSLNDFANSVQQTTDGGYIAAGNTRSFGSLSGGSNVYLLKTDSNGDTLWTKAIGNGYNAYGASVWQTSDGGYAIAGGMQGWPGQSTNVYLVKTDSSGDSLWTRNYGGTKYDDGFCLQQTTDGGFVITGITDYGPTNYNVYLIKTDSLGNTSPLVGVEEQHPIVAGEITIYPNPFAEQANLVLPNEIETNGEAELIIYDVLGNETTRVKITAQRALIQRDNLKAGLYFCKVVKENAVVATGKFIIH